MDLLPGHSLAKWNELVNRSLLLFVIPSVSQSVSQRGKNVKTLAERQALNILRQCQDIIIKPADKGSATEIYTYIHSASKLTLYTNRKVTSNCPKTLQPVMPTKYNKLLPRISYRILENSLHVCTYGCMYMYVCVMLRNPTISRATCKRMCMCASVMFRNATAGANG